MTTRLLRPLRASLQDKYSAHSARLTVGRAEKCPCAVLNGDYTARGRVHYSIASRRWGFARAHYLPVWGVWGRAGTVGRVRTRQPPERRRKVKGATYGGGWRGMRAATICKVNRKGNLARAQGMQACGIQSVGAWARACELIMCAFGEAGGGHYTITLRPYKTQALNTPHALHHHQAYKAPPTPHQPCAQLPPRCNWGDGKGESNSAGADRRPSMRRYTHVYTPRDTPLSPYIRSSIARRCLPGQAVLHSCECQTTCARYRPVKSASRVSKLSHC